MNIYLKKAKEVKAKMDALIKLAKDEKRVFTDEEKTTFNDLKKTFDENISMHDALQVQDTNDQLFQQPVDDNDGGINVKPPKSKWAHGGDFLMAVANHALTGQMDKRLVPVTVQDAAQGQQTTVPSEGGFVIESDLVSELLKRTYETSILASKCRKQPIGKNSNSLKRNYVDEASRASGSRWGGIRGYWIPVAGDITLSKQKIAQQETPLNKLAGLCYVTEEQLQDGVALLGSIKEDFPNEFSFLLDDAILNGNGAGQPLGVKNGGSVVSIAKETGQEAGTIVYENIVAMWARLWAKSRANSVWLINQDCEPQLQTMALVIGVGGIPVYMPAGGISATPYATLIGRSVLPVEQAETVGTTGDIWLIDLSQYQLIEKGGVRVDESIHVQFLTDQRAYRFIYRVGGKPIWTSVLTPFKGSDTLAPYVKLATRS